MLTVSVKKDLRDFFLDVDFHSEAEITALFAPSGSGKSLTLQTIAGLVNPDRGRIEVDGKVFFDSEGGIDLPPQMRRVGYLFQDYALFPHMKVMENIRYGSKNDGLIEKLVEILEIGSILDRYPSEISGGEKQRVALARAFAMEPRILLLDEPFSALHRSLKLSLYTELKELRSLFGIPVVLVSHDIEEVFELADFLVVMENGEVVQCGRPFEVFMNPRTVRIAKLLGHKSFLKGVVKGVEGGFVCVETERGMLLKCKRNGELKRGDTVHISILPFSLALSPEMATTKVDVLVKRIERTREFTRLVVDMGSDVELSIPSSLSPNFILEEGKVVSIYLSADYMPIIKEGS